MVENRLDVLLIEDSTSDTSLIREMLADAAHTHFELRCVVRLSDALDHLQQKHSIPSVVLLDLSLPDSHGLDTLIDLHRAG